MKKSIFYGAMIAMLGLTTSCEDFLTEEVRGSQNLDTYFFNQEEVDAAVNGCYFEIVFDDWWQIYNPWLLADMTTDDLWDGNTTQSDGYQEVTYFQPSAPQSGIISNFWDYRFKGIYVCNTVIQHLPQANMNEELKKQRLAEVRFLRAFFYFDLARYYGGVPLITEPLTNSDGLTRASLDDIYNFVEKELAEIAEDLPSRSQLSPSEMGRATSGAALGILAKTLVYHGKYAEAIPVLERIIDSNEYELLPNFGDVWSVHFNNSKESLFETQTMYSAQYALGSSITVISGCRNGVGDGWAWGTPTADLENAYIAAGDTERLRWTIIKTGCKEVAGETNFMKLVENNATVFTSGVNDDKYKDYMERFGWTDEEYEEGYIIDPAQHKSARIMRKYYLPTQDRPEVYDKQKIPLNHRILRFADILLLHAEACNAEGQDAKAQISLNKVRARVNLPEVTLTGKALRDAIRLERRLELAFEQCRLFDIRRWKADNGKSVMSTIFGPDGSFVKYNMGENADMYEVYNQGQPSDKGYRFDENRDLVYPVPTDEVQRSNGSIQQNPNY